MVSGGGVAGKRWTVRPNRKPANGTGRRGERSFCRRDGARLRGAFFGVGWMQRGEEAVESHGRLVSLYVRR